MRTTLTLDEDVASLLGRLQRERDGSFKELVNEALRLGLTHIQAPPKTKSARSTTASSLGGCLIGSLDDVSESLAVAEGDAFR